MPGLIEAPNPVTIFGYDNTTHMYVPIQVNAASQDAVNNELYASLVTAGGGGGGGGPVTGAVGSFVTDSIVDLYTMLQLAGTAGDANTVNSIMGRLTKIRDLLNATLGVTVANFPATQPVSGTVTVGNTNANGQSTMSGSAPVVLPSDQSPIPINDIGMAWSSIYQKASATETTAWTGSGDLSVGNHTYLIVNINVTAFAGTNYQFKVQRKDAFGNYYVISSGSALTSAVPVTMTIGPASQSNQSIGSTINIIVVYTAMTSITYSVDVQAR